MLPIPALLIFFRIAPDAEVQLRRLYLAGLCFFGGFYLVIWHWFLDLYPMEFMGVTKGEAIGLVCICWFGMTLLQSLLSALIFPLFGFLCRTRVLQRLPLLIPAVFAAQWAVNEWSQTLGWTGVPWARMALSQIRYGIFSNSAAFLGSYFIAFCLLAVAGYLAYGLLHLSRVRFCALATAAVYLCNLLLGTVGYMTADPEDGTPLVVAAVQGNVGSELKWTGDSREKSYEIYEKYTATAAEAGAEIVVFPEIFVPDYLTETNALGKFVSGLAAKYRVTIFCGAFASGAELDRNAVFMVTPDGLISENIYAKRHLVPFGEYVPWRPLIEFLLPALTNIGMLSEDLEPGENSALFDTVWGDIGALLCFDSIYETLTLESVRDGAELLILPTNDSWFTDSAGVYMHHNQAKLRAIESGRWVIRAADTGISSLIAPNGIANEELDPMIEGLSVGTAYLRDSRTLYSYIGNLFVYLLIAALLAILAAEAVLRIRRSKQ